jgi:hypothetical protein
VSDLVIRQTDGWQEITPLVEAAVASGLVSVNELWKMAAQDRTQDIEGTLRMSQIIDDFFGQKMPTAFRFVMVPDNIRGEWMRIWVTLRRVIR